MKGIESNQDERLNITSFHMHLVWQIWSLMKISYENECKVSNNKKSSIPHYRIGLMRTIHKYVYPRINATLAYFGRCAHCLHWEDPPNHGK